MGKSFGKLIRKVRKDKGYSQRELAKHLGVDFTYLSKLENDRADYAPKEEVIRGLAKNLNLNPEELIFLAGRIPQQYEEVLKQNPREMQVLFQRMKENPEFAYEISQTARENKQ
ncbi:MAG: helix-turn-helix transcriptional regulator [Trichodesmium sp. St16_bin4-tuft]|nr:helix-turn-helix domain-containing protein [Trichodesmium sp. MAG_R01]MDE5070440.1 helix-turn-helix transcriptional regulator [Trichodesmium sp. St5_bin8]MDE5078128.1 helix-turn-helix transcriptional regulator [Trichodesmium sp. St2_bin6]MDE5097207.1 helix-turn-helix transcriptional regulator [Trichodesmium sp. St16_bin4-tuft]MDE5102332.1 helix-turn-helix transcriptional regulator [Trichodesmium sp. St19_bin2]